MRVTVGYAAPGVELLVELDVAAGTTIAAAVAASGIPDRLALAVGDVAFAIGGQRAGGDLPVHDGDRIDLTRALAVDPKDARRRRAATRARRRA